MINFGIIVCCCRFDSFFAKGCIASIRYFYPNIPITLFTDDSFDTRAIEHLFTIEVIRREDIKDSFLRNSNTGWGLPKMTLFWEGPYERFLYLDADTLVWGDVIGRHLGGDDWDFVADVGDVEGRPWVPSVGTDAWLRQEYFNPDLMQTYLPQLDWRRYAPWFFCTGTFGCRRGVFDLDEYKHLLELRNRLPGLFPIGEMPLLNTLLFLAHQRGEVRLRRASMQMVCDYTNAGWLSQRFRINGGSPMIIEGDEKILHFTQPKPISSSDGFHEPFDFFRIRAIRETPSLGQYFPYFALCLQEAEWRVTRAWRQHGGRYHQLLQPLIAPVRKRFRGGR